MTKDILYSDLLDIWFADHRLRIAASTAYGYEMALPYIKKYFNAIYAADITQEMIYDYIQYLETVMAPTSVRLYCNIINISMNYGVKYHYLFYNPAWDVAFPRRARAEVGSFTSEEVYLLLETDGPEWVKDGIMIAFRTGMRPGEIYALKWSDIHFNQRFISVQWAISRANSTVKLKATKTVAGIRRIDIDYKLTAYLMQMHEGVDGEYLFPGRKREYRVPWNLSKYLKDMCNRAGIPPRDFYSLRHTHATVSMEHGLHPKIVQERLGHSSCKITMETYSHVSPTLQQEAVKIWEEI